MDKRYYYRILGLSEGATAAQVKQAYSKQIAKLKSPDYADDPEYVARKMDQVRHAYSVLLGGAAPATKEQREARFERRKDAEDAGEDGIEKLKRAFNRHTKSCEPETDLAAGLQGLKDKVTEVLKDSGISLGGSNTFGGGSFGSRSSESRSSGQSRTKKTLYMSPEEERRAADKDRSAKLAKIIVICVVGLSLFSSVITACGALIMNIADEISYDMATPEYAVQEVPAAEVLDPEAENWMDHIVKNCHLYDFYGNLDLSVQNDYQDQIEWDPGEETQSEIWSEMTDMAYYLGIYSNSDITWYITGDENFYWETDDFGNAAIMTMLMNPPAYEEIAGGVNLYRDEVILDYADYLRFLADVAEDQTEDIMGPAPGF